MSIQAPMAMTSPDTGEQAVAFSGTIGHVHSRNGPVGVVICSPWGFDALCTRKFHRLLAAGLAGEGHSTIRFDYPGEGDAAAVNGGADLECWIASALSAADELRRLSGCDRIVFYGLGLGGAIALAAAERYAASAGVVLAVPALNGRRFLRETGLRERVIVDDLGITLDYPDGSVSLAGFVLPGRVAADLKSFVAEGRGLAPSLPVLFLRRPDNAGDDQVLAGLREAGIATEAAEFPGYGEMMDGLNVSVAPPEPIAAVVDWMARHWPGEAHGERPVGARAPAVIEGDVFRETALTIGAAPGLFGMLCTPTNAAPRATVVFLNMAYTYHIGWGGLWVDAARALSADGIRSLRIDLSNIGDSPARPGAPEQVVYSPTQLRDIRDAVDWLRQQEGGPIHLVGTCSGAHAALTFAGQNPDIAGVVAVNQLRLVWDPDEDIEATLRAGARPLSDYKRRAFSLGTYRRLVGGEIDVGRAAHNLLGLIGGRLARALAPYLGTLTKLGRMRAKLYSMLRAMGGRGAKVTFVGCRIDGSLDEMARYFGPDLAGLRSFANTELRIIENTDHMLTPLAARRKLVEIIRSMALSEAKGPDFTQT